MRKLLITPILYLLYVVGYMLLAALIGFLVGLLHPIAGAIVGGLLALGGLVTAWEKTRDKLGHMSRKAFEKKMVKQWAGEDLDEFNRSAKQVSRQLY